MAFVQDDFQARQHILSIVRDNLQHAQNRMKFQVDKHRSEREFAIGDWVYLKLQPYGQTSLALRKSLELAAKYYGPFQVIQMIGAVAYKLQLRSFANIYPVFHVSLLKKEDWNWYYLIIVKISP